MFPTTVLVVPSNASALADDNARAHWMVPRAHITHTCMHARTYEHTHAHSVYVHTSVHATVHACTHACAQHETCSALRNVSKLVDDDWCRYRTHACLSACAVGSIKFRAAGMGCGRERQQCYSGLDGTFFRLQGKHTLTRTDIGACARPCAHTHTHVCLHTCTHGCTNMDQDQWSCVDSASRCS